MPGCEFVAIEGLLFSWVSFRSVLGCKQKGRELNSPPQDNETRDPQLVRDLGHFGVIRCRMFPRETVLGFSRSSTGIILKSLCAP
jgi:hypothetical protein